MNDNAARCIEVVVLHVDACPSVAPLLERLAVAGDLAGVEVRPTLTVVGDEPSAAQMGMNGSPTLLIGGVDPFPSNTGPALGCRLYHSESGFAGVPPLAALTAVLLANSTQRLDG